MDVPPRPPSSNPRRPSPPESTPPADAADPGALLPPAPASPARLFIHEPGWQVALKLGSERVFCYQMAPGQDYYHRLLDGEIYVYHGDERLCLACAERRGFLTFEPRRLGMPLPLLDPATPVAPSLDALAAAEFILDLVPDDLDLVPDAEPDTSTPPGHDPFDDIDFT